MSSRGQDAAIPYLAERKGGFAFVYRCGALWLLWLAAAGSVRSTGWSGQGDLRPEEIMPRDKIAARHVCY